MSSLYINVDNYVFIAVLSCLFGQTDYSFFIRHIIVIIPDLSLNIARCFSVVFVSLQFPLV